MLIVPLIPVVRVTIVPVSLSLMGKIKIDNDVSWKTNRFMIDWFFIRKINNLFSKYIHINTYFPFISIIIGLDYQIGKSKIMGIWLYITC